MKSANETKSDNSSQNLIFSYSVDKITFHRRSVPMKIFRMVLLIIKKGIKTSRFTLWRYPGDIKVTGEF